MNKKRIRVLIADTHPHVRSALGLLLQEKLEATVVGEADDLEQTMEMIGVNKPDLLLLDWELLAQNDATALTGLRTAFPDLAVIALSGSPRARREALAAGVDAFVSKGDPPERLVASVSNCCRRS